LHLRVLCPADRCGPSGQDLGGEDWTDPRETIERRLVRRCDLPPAGDASGAERLCCPLPDLVPSDEVRTDICARLVSISLTRPPDDDSDSGGRDAELSRDVDAAGSSEMSLPNGSVARPIWVSIRVARQLVAPCHVRSISSGDAERRRRRPLLPASIVCGRPGETAPRRSAARWRPDQ
jgi:hypothetical protein